MSRKQIPLKEIKIMKNSYGRLCLVHSGILLAKLGNIKFFESARMNNFHPVYDEKKNIIAIDEEIK